MTIQEFQPSPVLKDYVRLYQYSEICVQNEPMLKPVTPRPEQCLQFSFQEPVIVINRTTGSSCKAPPIVIAGRQTKRKIDLLIAGNVVTFTIQFQPVGFYRLFRIPLREITDLTPDAIDVVGPSIRVLYEQLCESGSPLEMALLVETFLLKQLMSMQPSHLVQNAAASIFKLHGQVDLAALASLSSTSLRQFERIFHEQVGVTPKLFSRIVRYTHALDLKYNERHRSWTDIAIESGYYDQMHLIHESKSLTDETPNEILRTWSPCQKASTSVISM